jgi:hypothetical protein
MYTFMPLSFLASIQQNHTKHYKANWIQRACFNMSDDDDFQMSADEEDVCPVVKHIDASR